MVSEEWEVYLFLVRKMATLEFDSQEYGKLAQSVVELLMEKGGPLSDDKIAAMLNMSAAEVRRVLQFLHRLKFIGVERRMTEDYRHEYFWYVNGSVIADAVRHRAELVAEKLSAAVKAFSRTIYYVCTSCYRRYSFEEASSGEFQCPLCGGQLEAVDMVAEIEKLNNALSKLGR